MSPLSQHFIQINSLSPIDATSFPHRQKCLFEANIHVCKSHSHIFTIPRRYQMESTLSLMTQCILSSLQPSTNQFHLPILPNQSLSLPREILVTWGPTQGLVHPRSPFITVYLTLSPAMVLPQPSSPLVKPSCKKRAVKNKCIRL